MKKPIEALLDECLAAVRAGTPVDAALAANPEAAAELRPLLQVALGLSRLPEPQLSVNGLMRALAQSSPPERQAPTAPPPLRLPFLSFPMLLRVAATVAAIFLIGWGVSATSAQAVPGDWMYPIKRAVERVKLMLTVNAANEAELRIAFSEQRMTEAVRKYERGGILDDALLRSMLVESKLAIEEALNLSPQERSYVISRVGYLSAHQRNVIETVKRTANPAAQPVATAIGKVCTERMQWMEGMMKDMQMTPPSCSGCWWEGGRQVPAGSLEEPAPQKQDAPDQKQMQRWMDACPDSCN